MNDLSTQYNCCFFSNKNKTNLNDQCLVIIIVKLCRYLFSGVGFNIWKNFECVFRPDDTMKMRPDDHKLRKFIIQFSRE